MVGHACPVRPETGELRVTERSERQRHTRLTVCMTPCNYRITRPVQFSSVISRSQHPALTPRPPSTRSETPRRDALATPLRPSCFESATPCFSAAPPPPRTGHRRRAEPRTDVLPRFVPKTKVT